MKKQAMQGIVNNLLELQSYYNPLQHHQTTKLIRVNLLTGEVLGTDNDDLFHLYKEKARWFQQQIEKEHLKREDIQSAELSAKGCTETANINYKGTAFKASKSF